MPNTETYPILAARSYAGGVIDCLSIADAFETRDPHRASVALEDAEAGLQEALRNVRQARAQRRRAARAGPIAAGIALTLAVAPFVIASGLMS